MKATFTHLNFDFSFTDADVVNPMAFIPKGEFNPHNVRPWLIYIPLRTHGWTLAVVFASCLQEALDEATDNDKLDGLLVAPEDMGDYGNEEVGITRLGNAGEPFDLESVDGIELPNLPFSFAAMFMAAREESGTAI